MSVTLTLIHIIGSVCLLLWGVRLVSKGFNRACGAQLRSFITKSTQNRVMGVFSGAFIATVLQSSTAVTLITASFASKGLLSTLSGISLVLGADVGTTLAAQILIFDLSWLVPILFIAGYSLTRMKQDSGQKKYIGQAILGIGVILLSLQIVVDASAPLRESESLQILIQPLAAEPVLAILFAGLLTWVVHSSLAMVLLFASFTMTGAIPIGLGLVLVLGANLGSACIGYMDTMSEKTVGRRIPLANLIIRFVGVVVMLPFIEMVLPYLTQISDEPARMIVNFHTGFNIALAVIFLPFIGLIYKMTVRILPEGKDKKDKNQPRYLDYTALDTPSAALASAERETLRISDTVSRMLKNTLKTLETDDLKLLKKVRENDDRVDILYDAVKKFLARITHESLTAQESLRHQQIMGFATSLEHIGDVIEKSLSDLCEKKIKHQLNFSEAGFDEISEAYIFVIENFKLSQRVFLTGDVRMARKLFEGKIKLKDLEHESAHKHMLRLQENVSETHSTSGLHLDIFRDLRRIQNYLASISYPCLERAGELHRSRLKKH